MKGVVRGSEGGQMSQRKVSGVEGAWRRDHIDKDGSNQISVIFDKGAGISSRKGYANASARGADGSVEGTEEDLELQLSDGEEEVGRYEGGERISSVVVWKPR